MIMIDAMMMMMIDAMMMLMMGMMVIMMVTTPDLSGASIELTELGSVDPE